MRRQAQDWGCRTATGWQDILARHFAVGRSGNEVLASARAEAAGIRLRSVVYTTSNRTAWPCRWAFNWLLG